MCRMKYAFSIWLVQLWTVLSKVERIFTHSILTFIPVYSTEAVTDFLFLFWFFTKCCISNVPLPVWLWRSAAEAAEFSVYFFMTREQLPSLTEAHLSWVSMDGTVSTFPYSLFLICMLLSAAATGSSPWVLENWTELTLLCSLPPPVLPHTPETGVTLNNTRMRGGSRM